MGSRGGPLRPLEKSSYDQGNLFKSSVSLLLAHEDKSYPGALIASLAIPWGEAKGDQDQGGYHLVWTRDMVNSVTALLAAGDTATPLRALIFLAVSQHEDGGFAQNFWVTGEAYWTGIQLDEVAFPILLAWRLFGEKGLGDFHPDTLVRKGAAYLIRNGPVTQQERWEEASGYSPSTLASNIAALICASLLFRERGDEASAEFTEEYADFLESHIEDWTVTNEGSLHPGIKRYYIRILPEQVGDANPAENPEQRTLQIKNIPYGQPSEFPAKDVVDGGFLELVRYGIRSANDPIIVDSVKVLDAVLKVDTRPVPYGIATITTAMASRKMAALLPASEWAGRGRCSLASEATTNWLPVEALSVTSVPWSSLPRPLACCRSRFGMRRTSRKHSWLLASPPVPPCRSCGRTPSTSSCFAPLPMARFMTQSPKYKSATSAIARIASSWKSGNRTGMCDLCGRVPSCVSTALSRSVSAGRAMTGNPRATPNRAPMP